MYHRLIFRPFYDICVLIQKIQPLMNPVQSLSKFHFIRIFPNPEERETKPTHRKPPGHRSVRIFECTANAELILSRMMHPFAAVRDSSFQVRQQGGRGLKKHSSSALNIQRLGGAGVCVRACATTASRVHRWHSSLVSGRRGGGGGCDSKEL